RKTAPVVLILMIISTLCFSQFKKGDRMVGATVASAVFNTGTSDATVAQIGSSTSKTTSYNVSITPLLGWFLSDQTVAGVTVTINPYGTKTTYDENSSTFQSDKSNTFNVALGGFVRNYFQSSGSMIPFIQ